MVASSNTWNLPVSSNTSTRLPHPPERGGSGLSSRCSTGGPRGRPKGFGQQFREQNERRKSEAPAPGFFFLRVEVILPDANGVFHELNRLNNIRSSAGRVGINTVTVNRDAVLCCPSPTKFRKAFKLQECFKLLFSLTRFKVMMCQTCLRPWPHTTISMNFKRCQSSLVKQKQTLSRFTCYVGTSSSWYQYHDDGDLPLFSKFCWILRIAITCTDLESGRTMLIGGSKD